MLAGAVRPARQFQLHLGQPVMQLPGIAPGQFAPRRVHALRGRAGDHRQKGRAIAFQLFRPNPGDAHHLVPRLWPPLGHLDQGAVGKHDIGRHLLRLGQLAPPRLER